MKRGDLVMKENEKTILYQMLSQIITRNQLTELEKIELRKILENKERKEEDKVCLASIIEEELENAIQSKQICEGNAGLYKSIFENTIKKSEICNMPATELSNDLIRKFVLHAGKIYGRDRTQLKCFTGMLQTGLNKMAEEDMLDFAPNRHVYKDYLMCPDREIYYIDNPYSAEETEKIKEWIELHLDNRGLAISLLFCGETTMEEIANLKKENCNISIFKDWERSQIISMALKLHPENEKFVFMEMQEKSLEKLTPQGFQLKLYHICNKLGIKYKRINRNEAIICKE